MTNILYTVRIGMLMNGVCAVIETGWYIFFLSLVNNGVSSVSDTGILGKKKKISKFMFVT